MLKIRLQRVGRIHEPAFRVVLTDSKNSTKSGRFKEILGSYDPRQSRDSLDAERIKYWLHLGASPTATIHNLLVKHGVISGKKIDVSAVSKKAPSATPAMGGKPVEKAEEPLSAAPAEEVAPEDVIMEPVEEGEKVI